MIATGSCAYFDLEYKQPVQVLDPVVMATQVLCGARDGVSPGAFSGAGVRDVTCRVLVLDSYGLKDNS